ncbi:MAG TPA: hypothetical protein VK681_35905 [Reyranella sp.]|nr:hypothetical protein [Reyranella sp.]
MPTYNPLSNSTFLDAYGANQYSAAQYQAVASNSGQADTVLGQLFNYGDHAATVATATSGVVTVGLVLNRGADPTALLSSSWAVREAALSDQAAIWATYGANQALYNATSAGVASVVGAQALLTASEQGYISSAADRTIWVTLAPNQFQDLFGTGLLTITATAYDSSAGQFYTYGQQAWAGNLGINSLVPAGAIAGLWINDAAQITNPQVLDATLAPLTPGPLGIGNSSTSSVDATPAAIAANYNFPLPADAPTPAIAVVEGDVARQAQLFADYNQYREAVGLAPVTPAQFQVLSGTNDPNGSVSGELALDISTIAGGAPNSTQLLYSDLGGTPFAAYQQAFFDFVNDPAVLTSSYYAFIQSTANSPFFWAWQQLFVDGALSNVSVHIAAGDQGAGANIYNGAANVFNSQSSPFALQVGGTSIASLYSAQADSTLAAMLPLALQDDPATVFSLVATGLKILPSHLPAGAPAPAGAAATLTTLFETVWQSLSVYRQEDGTLDSYFGANETGSGGVAPLVPTPLYQAEYGLASLLNGGRGIPDVSALSSGDTQYAVLNSAYVNGGSNDLLAVSGGTSAAAPLWASLTLQFDAIFHDQHLPNLGFYNDLLYQAAIIAPGSFNDVLIGNNINSFYTAAVETGYYNPNLGLHMVPTGQGYSAGQGYDLASGLGTPDGLLLARALTAIAHQQISYGSSPDFLHADGHGGWTSGADQSLLFQTTSPDDSATIGLDLGPNAFGFFSATSGSFAWTSRLAEQSLQADFDPGLALLFDKQAQGTVMQYHLGAGESLAVSIDSTAAQATQASLSNPFGFSDFFSGADAVRVARPVALAETVDGANDQLAVVRLRQVGTDSTSITFYRVDDLNGTINGVHPDDPGYQALLHSRAYQTTTGGTSIAAPGYGDYGQTMLQHVNSGDIVAMQLTDNTHGNTFSAFAQANEVVNGQHVEHLMNYGLNTWGWEDTYGGGDHDYNDLIVGLDFTSASGHGWLT